MNIPQVLALVIGLVGLAGVIFTAMKYNRDDTTSIVHQQDTLFNELRTLNDELRNTATSLREENAKLAEQVRQLTVQVEELRHERA